MTAEQIIIRPVLTEKSNDGIVAKRYVESVNVVNVRGKLKRQGRTQGYTSKGKKAYVKLTDASKAIPFFETLS